MKVIIEKDISEWVTPEDFAEMSDEDIIEMCGNDMPELLDNAEWKIIRGGDV